MSRKREKITYSCDCGINWSDCDKKNEFLIEYSDTGISIAHVEHLGTENESVFYMGTFTRDSWETLIYALTHEGEKFDPQDLRKLTKARGY